MNAGKAVYGILSANSGVTDIVGTNIFPEIAEQETAVPFIVYQLQSVDPDDTHDGPSKLDEVRFEFLCYADSYNAAADLGVAVRAALDRVSGTYNGVHVESIQFNDVDVNIEYDPRRYSQVLTFTFRIKRDDVTIALGTPVTGAVLGDLSDVDVDGVTNGQLIAYNSTSGNWEAANDAGGAEQLNDLTDVNITLPENRNVLMYDGEEWVEDNVSKSDVGLGNVDNTSDADKPVSSATQTALNAKADTSAVPTELNDLSDVTITGTPTGNQALIYDGTAGAFKSLPNFTNRFEDEAEINKQGITPFAERVYTVKADGDGIFIDPESDTPTAGKVIVRKIYHKAGFLESGAVIGDFTLIHTFADDTAYSATTSTFEGFRDGDTYGSPPFTLIQTWEEVDEATLLLDTYTGAAAAYSLRQLSSTATNAVRVRRASDNAEQDIGFSAGELDTTALATFCGSSNGFVKTWYSQAGTGVDATQTSTSNQPKIYDGTTGVFTENGKPAISASGSVNLITGTISTSNDVTIAVVTDRGSSTATKYIFGSSAYRVGHANTASVFATGSGDTDTNFGTWSANTQVLAFLFHDLSVGSNSFGAFNGGTSDALNLGANNLNSSISILKSSGGGNWAGNAQEIVIWDADQSSNRTAIESDINTFYSIY